MTRFPDNKGPASESPTLCALILGSSDNGTREAAVNPPTFPFRKAPSLRPSPSGHTPKDGDSHLGDTGFKGMSSEHPSNTIPPKGTQQGPLEMHFLFFLGPVRGKG